MKDHLHVPGRPQITGLVTSIDTNATVVVSLVKRMLFLLFWEQWQTLRGALRDLTCGSLVATIDEAYQ